MKSNVYIPTLSKYSVNELLYDCQNFQAMINQAPTIEAKDEMGLLASEYLAQEAEALCSPKVCTKSDYSFVLASDTEVRKGDPLALEFDETIVLEGTFRHISYFRYKNAGVITWPIYEAEVLNADELYPDEVDIEAMLGDLYMPAERQIRIPVHVPVGFIDFARAV